MTIDFRLDSTKGFSKRWVGVIAAFAFLVGLISGIFLQNYLSTFKVNKENENIPLQAAKMATEIPVIYDDSNATEIAIFETEDSVFFEKDFPVNIWTKFIYRIEDGENCEKLCLTEVFFGLILTESFL